MNRSGFPSTTVIISTWGRGGGIIKTIETILKNDYPNFDLIIVDQNEDDLTEMSLKPFLQNPRFHYLKSHTRGLSAGRNIGISRTESEFIALTDDDCEAPPNWLKELMTAFYVDHRIGVVFGNVESGPHDSMAGFIPTYVRTEPFLALHIGDKHHVNGISACMGIRQSLWKSLNGFDEMLGAGSTFKAGEETDFIIRALLAGYFVYETPAVRVIHQGFRTWEKGRILIQGYLYGTGAAFAKHFKCKQWHLIQILLRIGWRWAFQHSAVDFGHRTFKWLRLKAFLHGFLAGLKNPVDRSRGHFSHSYRRS
ncbi:MAG: glycosyltransferase [Thermodesulfobacteriota bacterium]|nr:glycosyltransferase [Thermodesulfobacteriota bacterium]